MKKIISILTAIIFLSTSAFAVDIKAKRVAVDDTGGYLTATNVEDAIQETQADIAAINLSGYVPTSRTVNGHALSSNVTVTPTDLGLVIGTNVQAYDADLTTYAGITPSANIQTLLGSADYSAARTNLGLAIGTNVQAYDADLTTYAGITPSANVQSLLGAEDYSAMRTQLSLVPGTDVQTQDSELSAIAGLTSAADKIPYFTGSGTAGLVTIGSGLSFSGGTLSASGSGTIGGSTGATDNAVLRADGTGGSTVQSSGIFISDSGNMTIGNGTDTDFSIGFNTLPSFGSDVTLTQKATTNTFEISSPGLDNSGNGSPIVLMKSNYGSGGFPAWFEANTSLNGLTYRGGADPNVGGFIAGRSGTSAGSGIAMYGSDIYPITITNNDSVGPSVANNSVNLGTSSYRFANVYSVLGNFSSTVSVADDAYAAGWNGSTNVPTKNAVYDKIETLSSSVTDSGTYIKPNTDGDEYQVFGSGGAAFLNIGMAINQPEITYNWTGNSTTLRIYNTEYSDSKIRIGNTAVSANDYLMIGSDSDVPFIAAPGTGYTTGIGFINNAVLPINHTGSEALGGLSYSNNGEALGSSSYRWSNVYSVLGNFSGRITAGTDIYLYDGSGESSNVVLQPETGDPGYMYEGYTAQGIYIGYRGSSDSKTLYVNTTGSGVMSLNVEGSSTIGTFEKLTPQASAPGSPTSGMIYTDSTPTPDELCFYDGAAWQGISSGTDANCA